MTVGLVREAAGQVGEVVANLVHFYNRPGWSWAAASPCPVTTCSPVSELSCIGVHCHWPHASGHRPPDTRRMVRHSGGLVLGMNMR